MEPKLRGGTLGIFDAPEMQDQWHAAMPDEPQAYGIDPSDGLPRPKVPSSVAYARAPDFDLDTFICAGDRREFVRRAPSGKILERFTPDEVVYGEDGVYRARNRRRWQFWKRWVEVRPVREKCRHYHRQLVDWNDDTDIQFMIRLCTMRKTDTGEFVSLTDTRMHGCDLRDPEIGSREYSLNDRDDALHLKTVKKKAEEEETFDVDAALQEENES